MNVTEALKASGFKPEKSTVGDKFIFKGVYRCSFFDVAEQEDKGYGPSIYAQFKIQETLAGDEASPNSKYPEFKGYFNTAPEKIANKRNGLAKLINGLFSAGHEVNTDDVIASLTALKGVDDIFISAYKEKPRKNVGSESAPEWVDDDEADLKQGWAFMTKKNAEKKAAKTKDAKPF